MLPSALRTWGRSRTRSTVITEYDRMALRQGLAMIDRLRSLGCVLQDATVLEIGTGWRPILPFLFRLAGARHVILTDREPLCTLDGLDGAAHVIWKSAQQVTTGLGITHDWLHAVLCDTPSFTACGFSYAAPSTTWEAVRSEGLVDLVFSRSVLEQMPPALVAQTFREASRVLRPEGWSAHIIDNDDYYSHTDPSLSPLFFLTQSALAFRLTRLNPLERMNRLRHSDYLRAASEAGMTLVADDSGPHERALADLRTLEPHPDFQHYTPDDLATLRSWFYHRR